jgi:ATP-dependent HslUV protease, peptidase subunit HslV
MKTPEEMRIRSTTIIAVRRNGQCAVAGDGQVTLGDMAIKHHARKIRTLYDGAVVTGFAGSTSDALTLSDRFEQQLARMQGNLRRAAVELSKEWRSDKYLRRLNALLIVADAEQIFTLSGDGDVIEPDDDVAAIGSGGGYAQAAARALLRFTDLDATTIARAALEIAASMCIYTNEQIAVVTLGKEQ